MIEDYEICSVGLNTNGELGLRDRLERDTISLTIKCAHLEGGVKKIMIFQLHNA